MEPKETTLNVAGSNVLRTPVLLYHASNAAARSSQFWTSTSYDLVNLFAINLRQTGHQQLPQSSSTA